MYLKFIIQLLGWFVFTILGPLVYICFPKSWEPVGRGFGKFKNKLIDDIWGNRDDGLSGDEPFRTNEAIKYKYRWLSSLVWSCFRNPVGNGKRSIFSASGTVKSIIVINNLKIVEMQDNSKWFFYHPRFSNGIEIKIGWKLWDDIKVNDYYVAKLGFSACKNK